MSNFNDTSFFSKNDIHLIIDNMKQNKTSSYQNTILISELLNSNEKELILKNIPDLINCSSDEFMLLSDKFDEMIELDNGLTIYVLNCLENFIYDAQSKQKAFNIAVKISNLLEEKFLPKLVSFLLLVAHSQNIFDSYNLLKNILTLDLNKSLYNEFYQKSRSLLSQFFNVVCESSQIDFFEFVIVILSVSRPSLRIKIPSILWNHILRKSLTMEMLKSFFSGNMVEVLFPLYNNIVTFVDIMISSIPKYHSTSIFKHFADIVYILIVAFNSYGTQLTDLMVSYVLTMSNVQSSIALYALLRVPPDFLAYTIPQLDDALLQPVFSPNFSVQGICSLISHSLTDVYSSMVFISIQKRLWHHSQILVQAGISLSLHIIMDHDISDDNDLFDWVIKSMDCNALVLKPVILLRVVDLIHTRLGNANTKKPVDIYFLSKFVVKLLSNFKILTKDKKDFKVAALKEVCAYINFGSLQTAYEAELCGELVYIIHFLLNNYDKDLYEDIQNFSVLKDMTDVGYMLPKSFGNFITSDKEENVPQITLNDFKTVLLFRSFIYPLLVRFGKDCLFSSFCFHMLEIIENSTRPRIEHNSKKYSELMNTQFSPQFIFKLLTSTTPVGIYIIYIALTSLHAIFFTEPIEHRFYYSEKHQFLESSMPYHIPLIMLSYCESIINYLDGVDKIKDSQKISDYINTVGKSLDFIILCLTIKDFGITFDKVKECLIDKVKDFGLFNRLIIIGYFLGATNLTSLCQSKIDKLESDLTSVCTIFPLGVPDIEEILHLDKPGANWRLYFYLCMQVNNYDDFYAKFLMFIHLLNDQVIPLNHVYFFMDYLRIKLQDYVDHYNNLVLIALELFRLVLANSHNELKAVHSLLSKIISMQNLNTNMNWSNNIKLKRELEPTILEFLTQVSKSSKEHKILTKIEILLSKLSGTQDLNQEEYTYEYEEEEEEDVIGGDIMSYEDSKRVDDQLPVKKFDSNKSSIEEYENNQKERHRTSIEKNMDEEGYMYAEESFDEEESGKESV